jgi:hypothetical protein
VKVKAYVSMDGFRNSVVVGSCSKVRAMVYMNWISRCRMLFAHSYLDPGSDEYEEEGDWKVEGVGGRSGGVLVSLKSARELNALQWGGSASYHLMSMLWNRVVSTWFVLQNSWMRCDVAVVGVKAMVLLARMIRRMMKVSSLAYYNEKT